MSEQTQSSTERLQASFGEHVRAFHAGLPPEEQALLEQVFQLAERAAGEQNDTAGHLNYTKITFDYLAVLPPQVEDVKKNQKV